MNAIYNTVQVKLAELIGEAIDKYKQKEEPGTLTDLFVQLNTANSVVAVYDDEEQLLTEVVFPEFGELSPKDDKDLFRVVENILRDILNEPAMLQI